jgi:hypothetical protein
MADNQTESSGVETGSPEQTPAENIPATPGEEQSAEPEAASKEQASGSLIVEDSVTDLSEGQMKKTEFLQKLRSSICGTIGPVLATVGQTTDDCPYLNYWLDLYQEKDAAHIEQTARKYAPDVSSAKNAEEYISIITQRALRAAEIWSKTGKITGVPDGVPTTLPGEEDNKTPAGAVQAKAKHGGVRKTDDPGAMQKELGDGQPLSPDVRSRMESAFNTSFSQVRTHTDATASNLSNDVNARAFTVGSHMAFGNGEYRPGTLFGDALIAHELAHTLQQRGSGESVNKMEMGGREYDALEQDADEASFEAVKGLWKHAKNDKGNQKGNIGINRRPGLQIQRCSKDKSGASAAKTVKNVTVDLVKTKGSSRNTATDLATASTVFSGCGVSFTAGQNVTVPDADSNTWLGGDTDIQVSSSCGSVSTEEKSAFDGAQTKYSLSSRMKFLYVNTLSGISALGYSIPPYCATGVAAPYVDHGVIPNNALSDTLAHELGHILINSGQHSGIDNTADTRNLMFAPGRTASDLDNSQCQKIYASA